MDPRLIAAANYRLKEGGIGLKIEVLGSSFWLRGTLPPKPSSGKSRPYQQRYGTGIPANPIGLRHAEALAKEMGARLTMGKWSWPEGRQQDPTAGDWVDRFRRHYFDTREGDAVATTWAKDYQRVYRDLPQDRILTPEMLSVLVTTTEPGSRLRERYCTALGALANFAQMDWDPRPYRGSGNDIELVDPRTLPTDEEIVETWRRLVAKNKHWGWAFGVMATYGIRPQEIWEIDPETICTAPGVITVCKGKTRRRDGVIPLHPEWWDLMDLEVWQPPVNNAKDQGRAASQQFRRMGVPFTPYDLRHAWAGRAAAYSIEVGTAALMMGHSVKVHEQHYSHWYTSRQQKELLERIKSSPSRPNPVL